MMKQPQPSSLQSRGGEAQPSMQLVLAVVGAGCSILAAVVVTTVAIRNKNRRTKKVQQHEDRDTQASSSTPPSPPPSSKSPIDGIPSPPTTHFLYGHRGLFGKELDYRVALRKWIEPYTNQYGQIGLYIYKQPTLMITHYEDARTVLLNETYRQRITMFERFFNHFLGSKSILILVGREWKYHRTSIVRALSPPAVLQSSRSIIASVTDTVIASIRRKMIHNNEDNSMNGSDRTGARSITIKAEQLMKMVTMDVFGRVAFSKDIGCCSDPQLQPSAIAQAFDYLGDDMTRRMRSPLWPVSHYFYWIPTLQNRRQSQQRQLLHAFLKRAIQERRKQINSNKETDEGYHDLLSELLRATDQQQQQQHHQQQQQEKNHNDHGNGNYNSKMGHKGVENVDNDEETISSLLQDILLTLLFAGYDTTSITLTYALYLISQHPKVEDEVVKEILSFGATNDPEQLKYCEAIVYETLRMFPPVNITTRWLKDRDVPLRGGFVAKANTYVMISIWLVQNLERHFPSPGSFRPDRWVKYDESSQRWVDRYENDKEEKGGGAIDEAYIPPANRNALIAFSAGARNCAGQKFAMQESVLVLAGLLKSLRFRPVEGYVLQPLRRGLVQCPKDGIPMIITDR